MYQNISTYFVHFMVGNQFQNVLITRMLFDTYTSSNYECSNTSLNYECIDLKNTITSSLQIATTTIQINHKYVHQYFLSNALLESAFENKMENLAKKIFFS